MSYTWQVAEVTIMNRDWRFWVKGVIPIIFTLIVLGILHIIRVKYGLFWSLAPAFTAVVMAIYHGGLWPGNISALLVFGYTFYIVDDPIRAIIIVASLIFIVVPVAILEKYRKHTDTVQGLIVKLREVHALTLTTMVNWPDWDDEEKWIVSERIHNRVSDILTVVRGWHLLAKEHQEVLKSEEFKKNVRQ